MVPALQTVSATNLTMLSDTAAGNVQPPPSVSKTGQYVVYTSTAANLAPGQVMNSETSSDVFLYNRATGVTTLVSHAAGNPNMTANGTSENAVISADGSTIAYVSNSDNLVAGETVAPGLVYPHHHQLQRRILQAGLRWAIGYRPGDFRLRVPDRRHLANRH